MTGLGDFLKDTSIKILLFPIGGREGVTESLLNITWGLIDFGVIITEILIVGGIFLAMLNISLGKKLLTGSLGIWVLLTLLRMAYDI